MQLSTNTSMALSSKIAGLQRQIQSVEERLVVMEDRLEEITAYKKKKKKEDKTKELMPVSARPMPGSQFLNFRVPH